MPKYKVTISMLVDAPDSAQAKQLVALTEAQLKWQEYFSVKELTPEGGSWKKTLVSQLTGKR